MSLWFTELDGDRLSFGFGINKVLYTNESEFQTVKVVETKTYGNMLVLDDFVMTTDKDEFVYHEMIAHVPMSLHENPKRIVVIGGGDGGTVRELAKYDCVEEIILCEIDKMVVDVSIEYFPKIASALDHKKVNVKIGDGIAFMKELENEVDIIIVDSTDPIGPGEGLFTGEFYKSVKRALRPNGIMVAQSESPWYEKDILKRIHNNISQGFSVIKPYVGSIPTYPRGLWSWTLACNFDIDTSNPNRERFEKAAEGLHYLTANRISHAFELPPFYARKLVD